MDLVAVPDWVVNFDGASRHNGSEAHPARAGFGFVAAAADGREESHYGFIGEATNNVAEFTAFAAACQWVASAEAGFVVIVGDSELLVEAFYGRRELRNDRLRVLLTTARAWLAMAGPVVVRHVRRVDNAKADALANRAVSTASSSWVLADPLKWVVPESLLEGWSRFSSDSPALPEPIASRLNLVETLAGVQHPSAADLVMPEASGFVAGSLHGRLESWSKVCSRTPTGDRVRGWVHHGVDVRDFFQHFRGEFLGKEYDSPEPPRAEFDNHRLDDDMRAFVTKEIARELRVGAISAWGDVGVATPPHLVLPVGVEPTKPRKLNDGRFLNLWCKDMPFEFEGLHLIPALVDKGEFAFNVDHVSGYFHVKLTECSRTFFGFQWDGVYYVYNVLNFGWKSAPYVYTCFSGETAGFLRRLGLRYLFLLDDSFGTGLTRPAASASAAGGVAIASVHAAVFVVVSIMVALGYFVHPTKSILLPSPSLRWLGLTVDVGKGEFAVPPDKAEAISALLREVLRYEVVGFKTLERVVGKLGSLSLAAPGIHIMMRQMYAALTAAKRSAVVYVPIRPLLRAELERCLAMQFWQSSVAPWKSPEHLTIHVGAPVSEAPGDAAAAGGEEGCSSAPVKLWYPSVGEQGFAVSVPMTRGGGAAREPAYPVAIVGETVLLALGEALRRSAAKDCFVTVLLHCAWRPGSVLSSDLSRGAQGACRAGRLFDMVSGARVLAAVVSVPESGSLRSREFERGQFRLSTRLWDVGIQSRFGPRAFDMMASDGNARCGELGEPLPHFTRWPMPGSAGTNVFSQRVSGVLGLYANPVFAMMAPFLHLLRIQRASAVVVIPGWVGAAPGAPWWPLVQEYATDAELLARRGTPGVFDQLSIEGAWEPAGPVPWDVWAFRFDASGASGRVA